MVGSIQKWRCGPLYYHHNAGSAGLGGLESYRLRNHHGTRGKRASHYPSLAPFLVVSVDSYHLVFAILYYPAVANAV
jgi:hypothetical protein